MRAGECRTRLIGAGLIGLAIAALAPARMAHGLASFDQPEAHPEPAAPAHLEWFNPKHPEPRAAWTPIERTDLSEMRVVLLVHGLDEPGSVWDDLAPELAAAVTQVQSQARSAAANLTLRDALGEKQA